MGRNALANKVTDVFVTEKIVDSIVLGFYVALIDILK
jgi:hypothetical protein